MCTALPFEYIQQADLRSVLMPSLVLVLLKNEAGVEAIRNEFCLSWLVTYLKDALKQSEKYKNFSYMLSPKYWLEALEYFENKTQPVVSNL
uniref:Uncharacterized protein n=1 Tax=Ditylenchus dipsaci TaxID=166011 RepID=A0A915D3K0_9BILA